MHHRALNNIHGKYRRMRIRYPRFFWFFSTSAILECAPTNKRRGRLSCLHRHSDRMKTRDCLSRCDERCRPRRDAPAADQELNLLKIPPCPAVPRRGPEAGSLVNTIDNGNSSGFFKISRGPDLCLPWSRHKMLVISLTYDITKSLS